MRKDLIQTLHAAGSALALLATLFFSAPASAARSDNRTAAEDALRRKDYPAAVSFFRLCREEAVRSGKQEELRETLEQCIQTCILAGMPAEAEQYHLEYLRAFPGADPLTVGLWKTEILLLRRMPEEAEKTAEQVLPGLKEQDPRRTRLLLALARAGEMQKKYLKVAEVYRTLLRSPLKEPEARRIRERLILSLSAANQVQEASEELLSLPEEQPESLSRRLLALYLLIQTDGFQHTAAAWDLLRPELRKNPEKLPYLTLSLLGDAAAGDGRYAMAADFYRACCECAPDKAEIFDSMMRLADMLEKSGDLLLSAQMSQDVLRLFRGPYASPELKLRVARLLRTAGKTEESVELYEQLASDPSLPNGMKETAVREAVYAWAAAGKHEKAVALIQRFYNRKQNFRERDFLLADLLLQEGKYEEAIQAFSAFALQYGEWKGKAWNQAALAAFRAKKYESALAFANGLLNWNPADPSASGACYLKGASLEKMGRLEDSLKTYREYLKRKNTDPVLAAHAGFSAGRLCLRLNRPAEGEKLFEETARKYPFSPLSPLALYWRIYSFQRRGKLLEAERETWQLAERYPDSRYALDAQFNLAGFYANSGSSGRAGAVLDDIARRVKTDAVQARVLKEKALLAYHAGDLETADLCLDRFFDHFPTSAVAAEAEFLRGAILRRNGRYEAAREHYQKVFQLAPDVLLRIVSSEGIGDCFFAEGGSSGTPEKFTLAENAYRKVLAMPELPRPIRMRILFKLSRSCEFGEKDDEALLNARKCLYFLQENPGKEEQEWAFKASEALIALAEKRPLRIHLEGAADGLRILAEKKLIPEADAVRRIRELHRLRKRY